MTKNVREISKNQFSKTQKSIFQFAILTLKQ